MNQNPKLIIQQGPSPGSELELSGDKIVIGREAPANVLIPGAGVSRTHSQLTRQGDSYVIEDLGSTNGTFLNGTHIITPTPLTSGDLIGLGQTVMLEYQAGGFTAPEASPAPLRVADAPGEAAATVLGDVASPEGSPPPQLVVAIAGSPPQTYALTRPAYTLGRLEDNDIVLNSPIVSRQHATLERTDNGGYRLVVPANVSNPVQLAGRLVTGPARLAHNSTLRIGGADPGMMVTMTYTHPAEAVAEHVTIDFGEKDVIQIGRDASNDVMLNVPQVSRYHAQIERSASGSGFEICGVPTVHMSTSSQSRVMCGSSPATRCGSAHTGLK
ncbi:MAG TPA: FHA domain-containing protein [Anaerolineales bacterium]|nr:FHA domain-containing protein [Anaerolineales bacterium]